jgi:hypothetical protein
VREDFRDGNSLRYIGEGIIQLIVVRRYQALILRHIWSFNLKSKETEAVGNTGEGFIKERETIIILCITSFPTD